MKLGVMNPVFGGYTFEEALKFLHDNDVHEMEIGAGGYPGDMHLKPEELIGNPAKVQEFKNLMAKYDVRISGIACHGNPLHPNKEIAAKFDGEFRNAILAAELLGVKSTRVKQLLKELLDEGVIMAEGSNKNRVYKLKA